MCSIVIVIFLITHFCSEVPVMMSLKPGSKLDYAELSSIETHHSRSRPGLPQLIQEQLNAKENNERNESYSTSLPPSTDQLTNVSNGQLDSTQCSPPKTENEVKVLIAWSEIRICVVIFLSFNVLV